MRIVIALDPAAPNADAFAALRALIQGMDDLEVCGLFVEDDDVLRYSSLPFARQVCVSSGVLEEVTVVHLERQLRARAARVQSTFDVAVRSLHGRARFDVRRGNVLTELRASAREADMLVIARGGRRLAERAWFGVAVADVLAAPLCNTLFVQEPWHTGSSVLVISVDDSKPLPAVAHYGQQLARSEHVQLHELDFVSEFERDAVDFGAHPLLETRNLIRACERLQARVLVLPDTPTVRARVDLAALVAQVPASVLLVQV